MAEAGVRRRGRTGARILDAALELFNRDGTGRVTTNHIAAHLRISPGNLYYWYPDKQAIVRGLWTRYAAQQAALWEGTGDDLPTPREMVGRLAGLTDLTREYLFVARDGLALVQEDPELREVYAAGRERALAIFGALARSWRADGLLDPVDDERLDAVVAALWTLTEAWLPYAVLHGGAADAAQAEALLLAVLEPYLPASGSSPSSARPAHTGP